MQRPDGCRAGPLHRIGHGDDGGNASVDGGVKRGAAPVGQAALFVGDAAAAAPLVDLLSSTVGRININTQCGRSPDVVPFSGRRSSAQGTMSVNEALRAFSIETVVAYQANDATAAKVAVGLNVHTNLFKPISHPSHV